jgi:catechol 2,3-dioxygenase
VTIDPEMRLGPVRLRVADLAAARGFYERVIGLSGGPGEDDAMTLSAEGTPVVELLERPDAPQRPPRSTGLFHLAILVPDRLELARALRRVSDAGWRFTGASDHLVSEALYLSDPEGNGIEIYRDRPREEWPRRDGTIQMATLPLDLEGVLSEVAGESKAPPRLAAGTRIGHVHLNVAELTDTERFYNGALGLDVTVRDYPGALFLSAGGYHHHVGTNTWAGEGAAPPPPGSLGLERYEVLLPGGSALEEVETNLAAAGFESSRDEEALQAGDPSGNRVLIRAPAE